MKAIRQALISVYYKDGLEEIVRMLDQQGVKIWSTGGTRDFIESLGVEVFAVEDLTGYPSILDGRVKTLHPKVFGGILARREAAHQAELAKYEIPEIDLVIVDLYPFEETVASTTDEPTIIEKIDIGGISLIRAAAKNYNDVCIIASRSAYTYLADNLRDSGAVTDLDFRKRMAAHAFDVSSHYDAAIYNYFNKENSEGHSLKVSFQQSRNLRYGENPHQGAQFFGLLEDNFEILCGKELSYNNLLDVDAAMNLMQEFKNDAPTFAVLKHNNACGLATRATVSEAWDTALAGDPVSAFGGILICNAPIDVQTAQKIDQLFYEVLIAPGYDEAAYALLSAKKNRILLLVHNWSLPTRQYRSLLNGAVVQDMDRHVHSIKDFKQVTVNSAGTEELEDLLFAVKCVKHLKSNAIALVKDKQLIGMGCGQTSRVDALKQAIHKARSFQFDVKGAVMASEAFFPFPDCVEIAYESGMRKVIQPGGSIKDADSIAFCDANDMSMYLTGIRHFKH